MLHEHGTWVSIVLFGQHCSYFAFISPICTFLTIPILLFYSIFLFPFNISLSFYISFYFFSFFFFF